MFTVKEACDYLGMSLEDLDRHLDLKSGHGYIFCDENGDQVIHDCDVERIVMRLQYAKELKREKDQLQKQHGIASIDL